MLIVMARLYRTNFLRRGSALAIAAVCLYSVSLSQERPDYKPDKKWQQVCDAAKSKPLNPVHPSGPLTEHQLTICDETALYYGIGTRPDYSAALQCGWYQRAHPRDTEADMFYGPGVLSMLYANGKGVGRNYDLAIRFSCEDQWAAEAEMAYRIGRLEHLRDTKSQNATFDLCDDITSGLSDGTCTSIQTRKEDVQRSKEINSVVQRLPRAAQALFKPLQQAELAFEQTRSENEVDLSGTSRAAFQLAEEARLGDQFLVNLRRFGTGDIPAASDADLSSLDRKLNEVYQSIEHSPPSKWKFGTVKPDGIRDTERKWVSLQEAWLRFARVAYPTLSLTAVRAQLIRLRLHQLRSLGAGRS